MQDKDKCRKCDEKKRKKEESGSDDESSDLRQARAEGHTSGEGQAL